MQLGFFMMPSHPLGRDLTETLYEDREMVLAAERLGFVEGFIGEHLTDLTETIASPLVFIAWLLNETKRMRLGTGTINLPNHHPAIVAAEVAMVDHLSKGRLIFGISPGAVPSDAEIVGTLGTDRTAMLVEAIDHILALWLDEPPYRRAGRFWNISTERTINPELGQGGIAKPFQRPHPPIVVTAVAPFSQGVTEAAARGWEVISANFLLPKWVKSHWGKYVEGCARAGRSADPANWRVAKSIFVADDMETARRYATGHDGPYYAYFDNLGRKLFRIKRTELFKEDPNEPDSALTIDTLVDRLVIWGTPEKVADELLALREQTGEFGTLLYAAHDWVDKKLAFRSMELMTEKVMPALNRACGQAAQ